MDLPQNPESPAAGDASELDLQLRSLRAQFAALLAAVLCLGGALFLYLYRQVANVNRQITESSRLVSEFQTNALPKINWFFVNLQTFAKTNPDFNPILGKYNLLPPPGAPGSPAPKK